MENLFFTPRRALRIQLAGLRDLLRVTGAPADTVTSIFKDARTPSLHFRLDSVTTCYLSCPQCHCLYPYHRLPDSDEHTLPMPCCTYKRTPQSSPCGEPLWRKRILSGEKTISVPRRKYIHHDLKSWVGRLLSRNGIEELLDAPPSGPPDDLDVPVHDIWSSKVFLALRDPSGRPFFPSPDGGGRLIFSLSVDSFNPFHMKVAKQSASSTGIWLVLLNLPPQLRYLPENMFLSGVIPGPSKPSVDQINHALGLTIKDLLQFWDQGVFFTRTRKHPHGRTFLAMLVPLIADMLAARQVVGLPGVSTAHYFCTFCNLDIDDIDVLDRKEWPAKDPEHIRRIADMWKAATSEGEQEDLFDTYGIRWSVLFDLPYWNPVLYTVIDSMHVLDLNLFQNHCRVFFKINLKAPGGDGFVSAPVVESDKLDLSAKDQRAVDRALKLIGKNEQTLQTDLLKFDRRVLYAVCVQRSIFASNSKVITGTKWVLTQNICNWVSFQPARPSPANSQPLAIYIGRRTGGRTRPDWHTQLIADT